MVILIWTFAFCLCSSVPLTMYTSLSDFRITFAPVWLLILLRLLPSLPMTKPLYPSGISTSSPPKDCSWILFFIFSCRGKTGRHAKSAFPLKTHVETYKHAENITGDEDRFIKQHLYLGGFRENLSKTHSWTWVIFLFFKEMYVLDPKLASGKANLVNLFQNVP